jgi:hypothetical protein
MIARMSRRRVAIALSSAPRVLRAGAAVAAARKAATITTT